MLANDSDVDGDAQRDRRNFGRRGRIGLGQQRRTLSYNPGAGFQSPARVRPVRIEYTVDDGTAARTRRWLSP
ncbi:MAG: Ig-like domain-containing protein [Rhodospirillales bacterium]